MRSPCVRFQYCHHAEMAKTKEPSDEDRALWRETMRAHDVRLNKKAKLHAKKRKSAAVDDDAPHPRIKLAPKQKPKWVRLEKTPHPTPRKTVSVVQDTGALPPLDKNIFGRISDGKRVIDERIDLHHMTAATAHAALLSFVQDAYEDGARTLLVITGKGKDGTGILRTKTTRWLESNPACKALISGIAHASPRHGGEGAFYIMLRKKM